MKQTVVAALGVTFGISMYISMSAMMTGSNKMLDELMLKNAAHVRIFNKVESQRESILDRLPEFADDLRIIHGQKPKEVRRKIRNSRQVVKALRSEPDVVGAAPSAQAQVFYRYGSTDLNGVLMGIEPEAEEKLFNLSENLVEGDLRKLETVNDAIIIGIGLSRITGAKVGDRIRVVTSDGLQVRFIVVGIIQKGISMFDEANSYIKLSSLQQLLGENSDFITDINVRLVEIEKSAQKAVEYQKRFDTYAEDYYATNAQYEASNQIRNGINYAVSFALLLVAGFGIYNILNMLIYEKMDDFAILKAVGFSASDILQIVITEALLIGFLGGMLGLGLGYVFSLLIGQIPFESDAIPNITTLPVNIDIWQYITGILFALLTTFLSGFLPARRASRLDPVQIIRGK